MNEQTIPVPNSPHWLQRVQFITDPLGYFNRAADTCGDIFRTPVINGQEMCLFVSHPNALQQIFTSDTRQFSAPKDEMFRPVMGDYSLFLLEGSRHDRERKLLMPPFHGERMRSYGETICQLTQQVFQQLPLQKTFVARSLMQEISMEVILRVVFGVEHQERFQQLKQVIGAWMELFTSPLTSAALYYPWLQQDWGAWSPWGKFNRLKAEIKQLIYTEISDRRQNYDPSRSDILTLLLSARDEQGKGMSDVELHDELVTILLAGHETTATAMAWALYWVHHLPQIGQKLKQELRSLGAEPEPMAIYKQPYLTAVCQETLRIYPVVLLTFARQVREPLELMGYQLKPGTLVYGCIYLTHQREDLYPQPKQFRPERFLERQYTAYEFVPFGGGVRRCLGEALALFEMKLVLATILANYELTLADSEPEKPQRRAVTLAPGRGVKLKCIAKKSPVIGVGDFSRALIQ